MEVEYTFHFWDRFERRKEESPVPLTRELLEEAISSPDFILPDPNFENREWRVKRIGGRCLRIVVEVCCGGSRLVAITLMFDRNLKRKGLCE